MRLYNSITAKVLVCLAGALFPVETVPAMACNCGGRPGGLTGADHDVAEAATVPGCHVGRLRTPHSCCDSPAIGLALRGSCCGADCSCSCCRNGGARSQGSSCQCVHNGSPSAPDPLPSDSRTDSTKRLLTSAPCRGLTAVVNIVPRVVLARADQRSASFGSSAPERLSVLCRLVI